MAKKIKVTLRDLDDRFEKLFPAHSMEGEEVNVYIERLGKEGIVFRVWKNVLLDNFLEFRLAKQHKLPCRFINVECASVAEARRYAINIQFQKPHLTKYERAVLAIQHFEAYFQSLAKKNQKLSRGRGKKGRKKTTSCFERVDVNELLAQKAHVGRGIILQVKKILLEGTVTDKANAKVESKAINSIYEDIKHRKRHTPPPEHSFRNNLKAGPVDSVICKDAVDGIKCIPDSSVALCVTSPRFNCGRNYPDSVCDDTPNDQHLEDLRNTFAALLPKFRKGGRCIIEYQPVRSRGADEKKRYYSRPVHQQIVNMMEAAGYIYADTIIWAKKTVGRHLAVHGPYSSPHKPLIRNCHSYLFVFCANDEELECQTGDLSELSEEDFEPLTQSIWYVAPEHKAYGSNPCPMPLKLAEDIIKMWSFKGDLCVDIFGGSGTTAVAALRQERHYIHIDCSPTCCADAQRRIAEEKKKLNQNDGSKKAA